MERIKKGCLMLKCLQESICVFTTGWYATNLYDILALQNKNFSLSNYYMGSLTFFSTFCILQK